MAELPLSPASWCRQSLWRRWPCGGSEGHRAWTLWTGFCGGSSQCEQSQGAIPAAHCSGLSSGPLLLPQSRTYLGMSTLRDLIFKRPSRQFQYLHVLLDLSSHEKDKVTPHHPAVLCWAMFSPSPVSSHQPSLSHVPLGACLPAAVSGGGCFSNYDVTKLLRPCTHVHTFPGRAVPFPSPTHGGEPCLRPGAVRGLGGR